MPVKKCKYVFCIRAQSHVTGADHQNLDRGDRERNLVPDPQRQDLNILGLKKEISKLKGALCYLLFPPTHCKFFHD